MKNRQLFQRDPSVAKLLNDGVAAVREAATAKEIETLKYELEHFVCEGQYDDGLIRILESYLGNRSLANFEIPLEELTLLLGPNGVGKTSVLDVVFAVRRLLSGQAKVTDDEVFPTPTLTRWQKRNKQVFEFDLILEGDDLRYRIEVEHDRKQKKARICQERRKKLADPYATCISNSTAQCFGYHRMSSRHRN